MASKNDEKTKEVILQLSDFLRYVLYDTASEFISLEKEAEIIKTYVELQKARINSKRTSVVLTVEGNLDDCQITPLLLLPLAINRRTSNSRTVKSGCRRRSASRPATPPGM